LAAPLTKSEVERLVNDWYRALDVHAPVEELFPMLADGGLEMRFPEGTFRGHQGAEDWYHAVINEYFDEVHTVKDLDTSLADEEAEVKIRVNWQARIWNRPAAQSEWLGYDAFQTWKVGREPQSRRAVIVTYIVDKLEPIEQPAG